MASVDRSIATMSPPRSRRGGKPNSDPDCIQRIPAVAIERQIEAAVRRLCAIDTNPLDIVLRIELSRYHASILLPADRCEGIQARLVEGETHARNVLDDGRLRIDLPLRIRNQRGRTFIETGDAPRPRPDAALIGALRKAHTMIELDSYRLPICGKSPATQYERRILQLAFLAPDLQARIMAGRQPVHLNLEQLTEGNLPVCWNEQRKLFT